MAARISRYINSYPLAAVLILAGAVGFALGFANATWQVTVETAQAITRIVEYPPENSFYIYHLKLFTIINQITAILLTAVPSERAISVLVSALIGMISFQAVAVFVFAINRNVPIAIISVMFVYFANYVGDGAIYPIWMLGQPHTYGILGLFTAILTIALLGAKAYRAALFLLPIAPAVHPSLGTWLVITVAVSAALNYSFTKQIIRRFYPYLIAGAAVTLASIAFQFHLMQSIPDVPQDQKKIYFDAFLKYWASHHQKLYWGFHIPGQPFKRWGVIFCIISVVAAAISKPLLKEKPSRRFMLTVIMISGIGSLLLGLLTQLPPQVIPSYLMMFMPGRFLNISNVTLVAMLFGVFTFRDHKPYVCNYNTLFILLIASFFARHCEVQFPVFLLAIWWLAYLLYRTKHPTPKAIMLNKADHNISYELMFSLILAAFLINFMPQKKYADQFLVKPELEDRTNNEFYSTIADRSGLLLITHESPMIAMITRRPILAEISSPNIVTYAPEAAPEFNRVLKEIYEIDLLVPPPEEYRHMEIAPQLYRKTWEQREPQRWAEIGTKFNVTDILTPEDWSLRLEPVAKAEGFILYQIPKDIPEP